MNNAAFPLNRDCPIVMFTVFIETKYNSLNQSILWLVNLQYWRWACNVMLRYKILIILTLTSSASLYNVFYVNYHLAGMLVIHIGPQPQFVISVLPQYSLKTQSTSQFLLLKVGVIILMYPQVFVFLNILFLISYLMLWKNREMSWL